MIQSIEFNNFKALRKTTLPLSPFTLLLGPNGSGKSSVLQGIGAITAIAAGHLGIPIQSFANFAHNSILSITCPNKNEPVELKFRMVLDKQIVICTLGIVANQQQAPNLKFQTDAGVAITDRPSQTKFLSWLSRMQIYTLDANAIAQPVVVSSTALHPTGNGLAAVLDDLKDNQPERWESLLNEMQQWLPEYDHILFDRPQQGQKSIVLRTKKSKHRIPAMALSQGTLIALALLGLAYLPVPPTVVCLEEIDRGLHPRLLRHLQDALYRLSQCPIITSAIQGWSATRLKGRMQTSGN